MEKKTNRINSQLLGGKTETDLTEPEIRMIEAYESGPFTRNPKIQSHEESEVEADRETAKILGLDALNAEAFIKNRLMERRYATRIRQGEQKRIGENVSYLHLNSALKREIDRQDAAAIATAAATFVPNKLQRAILKALDGRALKKADLGHEVFGGADSRLYNSRTRKGDLNELRDLHLVEHKPRLGYYRPDAPPVD